LRSRSRRRQTADGATVAEVQLPGLSAEDAAFYPQLPERYLDRTAAAFADAEPGALPGSRIRDLTSDASLRPARSTPRNHGRRVPDGRRDHRLSEDESRSRSRAEAAAVNLGPGEGHAHYPARGSEMFFEATAGLGSGDLSLMERAGPGGDRGHVGNTSAERPAAGDPHPAMDGYLAGLHELWNRPVPPSPDEEPALMSRSAWTPPRRADHDRQ
jgi:hypothetical protein